MRLISKVEWKVRSAQSEQDVPSGDVAYVPGLLAERHTSHNLDMKSEMTEQPTVVYSFRCSCFWKEPPKN